MSAALASASGPVFEAAGLTRRFDVSPPALRRLLSGGGRRVLTAVDNVSFAIARGETFALVGESGCGKSTVARMAVGLQAPSEGAVRVHGESLVAGAAQPALRRRLNLIFQDPYASLNPRWRVRDIVAEPLRRFGLATGHEAVASRVGALLLQVGLAPQDAERFPHEFSGGQRQRISVARALSAEPEFLVCDEPTSALDVSVQAQILNLMSTLQQRLGLAYLFISHNLAVVRQMADTLGVMYLGRIVEQGAAEAVLSAPRHPYTRMLLDAVPELERRGTRVAARGEVPSPIDPPPGCHFHPRCPLARERCRQERPKLLAQGGVLVACHAAEEGW